MTEEKMVVRRRALAKWLKESILRLGPTFIKIGQQFSTRLDILAQEYVDQLSELQDEVPPFPSETAVSIIEEELGAPLGDIFDQFDYEPIAAASLGTITSLLALEWPGTGSNQWQYLGNKRYFRTFYFRVRARFIMQD
eukprot:TRINITY_DN26703_c1_g1_i1.p1 TRINITY_DN26703_c1_g1~~TRINITY_DN26703_c1_g1_i1.p1  ORF type:complete len:138 (+),score=26.18 TRINITY_DN26703_c1_g1_i1:782-1195(+)